MNPGYLNTTNLFHLYDDIGRNVSTVNLDILNDYSLISAQGTAWPNCVYNINKAASYDDTVLNIQKSIFELPVKPLLISVDNNELDKTLRKNGYFPVEQWVGMHIQVYPEGQFAKPTATTIHFITDINRITEWVKVVSEVLFKGKTLQQDIFTYLFEQKHYFIFIEKDKKIIGTSLIYIDEGNIAGIYMFCIMPAYQGMGLGKSLLKYCLSLILKSGRDKCILQSTKMGLRLYESVGFERSNTYNLFIKIK